MSRKISSVGFFDGLKGILVFLIVAVHAGNHVISRYPNDFFVHFLISRSDFVVAIFFILAGLFFKRAEMDVCIRKNLKSILKPYFIVMIFAVLGTAGYSILLGEKEAVLSRLSGQLLGFLLGANTSLFIGDFEIMRTGAAWFLVALFLSKIMLNAIFCWSEEEKKRAIAVVILALLGMGLTVFSFSPYCIAPALLATGYLYTGYLLQKIQFFEKKQSIWVWLISLVIIIITFKFRGPTMALNKWPLGFLDYLGMICISVWIIKLYYCCFKGESRVAEKLSYVGRCSLWGICVHAVEMRVAWWYLIKDMVIKIVSWMDHVWIDVLMEFLIDITITLLGMVLVDHFIKRVKRSKAQKRRKAMVCA